MQTDTEPLEQGDSTVLRRYPSSRLRGAIFRSMKVPFEDLALLRLPGPAD